MQRALGWCHSHYTYHRRHGHPAIRVQVCRVPGCGAPMDAKQLCKNHYERWKRGNDPEIPRQRSPGWRTSHGYMKIWVGRQHTLSEKSGWAYEHRVVLYEKVGSGPQRCTWCGCELHWHPQPGQMPVRADHLDKDPANNAPENIVVSCHNCNITGYRRKKIPKRWTAA